MGIPPTPSLTSSLRQRPRDLHLQGYFYGYSVWKVIYHKASHYHAHIGCEVDVFADPETLDSLCPHQEAPSPHVSGNFTSENPTIFFRSLQDRTHFLDIVPYQVPSHLVVAITPAYRSGTHY